jgi:hypothetical protein
VPAVIVTCPAAAAVRIGGSGLPYGRRRGLIVSEQWTHMAYQRFRLEPKIVTAVTLNERSGTVPVFPPVTGKTPDQTIGEGRVVDIALNTKACLSFSCRDPLGSRNLSKNRRTNNCVLYRGKFHM